MAKTSTSKLTSTTKLILAIVALITAIGSTTVGIIAAVRNNAPKAPQVMSDSSTDGGDEDLFGSGESQDVPN